MIPKIKSNIAVSVLFNSKKGIYTQLKDPCLKYDKQVNLLVIVDGENRYYRAFKNLPKLLKSSNTAHKGVYHFCMNYLNDFGTVSARTSIKSTAKAMVTSKLRLLLRKKNG